MGKSDKFAEACERSLHNNEWSIARRWGVDPAFADLREAMTTFYMLERLEADGSTVAKRALREYERRLADTFASYIHLACGGEVAYFGRVSDEGEEPQLSCGCHCWECHGDSVAEEYCDIRNPRDVPTTSVVAEYGHLIPDDLIDYLDITAGEQRTDKWEAWARYTKGDRARYLRMAEKLFGFDDMWASGYGGYNWESCARLTADYLERKISPRVFVNMAWSLQHNNGCVFDKLWCLYDWSASPGCSNPLDNLLEAQAQDRYGVLYYHATDLTKKLWRVREYHISSRKERDVQWLGVQPTVDLEVAW